MSVPLIGNWRQLILAGLHAPVTANNLRFLDMWAAAEGGGAENNPFNTTLSAPGATDYNSAGVKNYPNPTAGIQATIRTLSEPAYGQIVGSLRASRPPDETAHLVLESPWGTTSFPGVSSAPADPSAGIPGLSTGTPAGCLAVLLVGTIGYLAGGAILTLPLWLR